jgi:hypothetical protein
MKVSHVLIAVVFTVGCGGAVSAQRPATQPATPATDPARVPAAQHPPAAPQAGDAAVLTDFKMRVDNYVALRKQAVKDIPPLKETKDAGKIKAAQDAMNAKIVAARAGAKHGDIFTPEITAKFRRLLAPELKGDDGRDAKAIMKDDAPTNVPFKVNAKYPDGASVPTVPANLLGALPLIPAPLQYRFIDKHLVLLDEDADVIVDYALNVLR